MLTSTFTTSILSTYGSGCRISLIVQTLTRNIRHRRGSKVVINPPIFHDINTPKPFLEDFSQLHNGTDPLATRDAKPDHVYLDAMGFGMGCSCLQITFQACCIDEARLLYDQLVTICPIVMALSAATPAIRGYLVDTDCRWGLISASVDDRTEEERGLKPLKENKFVLPKSRYDTVSSYLSPMGEAYNDIPLVYDPEFYEELISGGVDHLLAQHVAHLFTRDPISVFKERVLVPEGEEFVEHFENIQSTNWQSMRFKPPPLNSNIGWRVEFRPTELQLTDFENAAFVTFILLLSRTILRLKLNLLIPISKVDENMAAAMKRDAVRTGMFYFRQSHRLTTDGTPIQMTRACAKFGRKRTYSFGPDAVDGLESTEPTHKGETPHPTLKPFCLDNDIEVRPEESYTLMTISEIMNGSEDFPGLLPLVRHYVNASGGSDETVALVHRYLNLLECRASGHIMTTASWMRSRIMSHPLYAGDSRVTPEINTDLMRECRNITQGLDRPPELLPPLDGICIKPNARCRFGATCKKCNYNDEDFCCEDSTKTITVQENEDENNT
ncbi:Glutamate--cysteine ligase catalytic subunit [Fasciola hepatica]|uniref:Glutamate--cysteine ligase n=1 Tax=Fasciola hepatica TaxID=6192 RepID=A0A4E0RDB0_FASHE|nr:Glutamate--cysteine ligase catalytic subunit [Fasciola hepatica]